MQRILHFTPRKGIQDSLRFWIPRRGLRIRKTGLRIAMVSGIPDSLSCIPESKALDFGIPQAKSFDCLSSPGFFSIKGKKFYYSFHIYLIKFQITFTLRYVITKFYGMDSLPNFLTRGAPLARFARESSAIKARLVGLANCCSLC